MQQFLKIFGTFDAATSEYAMTASRQSLSTSIINAGEFIGAASAFAISSRFGRRGGLFVSSGCVLVGVVMQAAATHLVVLILGRLVLGKHCFQSSIRILLTTSMQDLPLD